MSLTDKIAAKMAELAKKPNGATGTVKITKIGSSNDLSDDYGDDSLSSDDAKEECANALMDAIKSNDAQGVAKAILDLTEIGCHEHGCGE